MINPEVVVIAGPTASGKTSLAIEVASALKTEIISADSRQFYRELNIGVARPKPSELKKVPHHYIAYTSVSSPVSAGLFAEQASITLREIIEQHGSVVVCGGSGLYIQALLNGLSSGPPNAKVREEIALLMEQKGFEHCRNLLLKLSPDAVELVDLQNSRRVLRALELVLSQNNFIGAIWKSNRSAQQTVFGIYLNPEREQLYNAINNRVLKMMEEGLISEVQSLTAFRTLTPLQTVGYSEIFEFLDGTITENAAVELIQQHTRNYAKRQFTWFKNKTSFTPLSPETAFSNILQHFQ